MDKRTDKRTANLVLGDSIGSSISMPDGSVLNIAGMSDDALLDSLKEAGVTHIWCVDGSDVPGDLPKGEMTLADYARWLFDISGNVSARHL